ncbi:MAG: hypothetical protein Q8K36_01305 [Alphaproteobacteria bacterium]|nr:hypothetical protein [Alphaproteobacteria bacterium]
MRRYFKWCWVYVISRRQSPAFIAINVTWNQMSLMLETLPMNQKNFEADTEEINDVVDTIIFQDALKQSLKRANLYAT